jgi:pimeloyl-ACP methyl ester carboxylesterase
LAAAAQAVLKRLEREPVRVALQGVTDPKTGEAVMVTLGPSDFQKAQELRAIEGPAFVLSLYHEHYGRWAHSAYVERRSRTAEFPLIGPLIDTSLGVTPARRYRLQNDPAVALLGQWNFDAYLATAEIWPSPDVGDDFRTEVDSSIPVVFVQGDWDVQTPIENVLEVAPYFRNGRILVVERGGHGALSQVVVHSPQTAEALLAFVKDGGTETLPSRVTLPAPRFPVPDLPSPR